MEESEECTQVERRNTRIFLFAGKITRLEYREIEDGSERGRRDIFHLLNMCVKYHEIINIKFSSSLSIDYRSGTDYART